MEFLIPLTFGSRGVCGVRCSARHDNKLGDPRITDHIARENMKAITRVLIAMVAAVAGLFVSTGTSNAVLDNEMSLMDGQDRTLTIQQWDTHLEGVFPLDRNRLTREWFHTGRAKYICGGACEEFEGTLELGYQSASRGRWVWASASTTPRRTS